MELLKLCKYKLDIELHCISAYVCSSIYPFSLQSSDRPPLLKNLRSLNLSDVRFTNDESLVILTRRCPKLQVLDVSWCSELSDISLETIAPHCTRLVEVFLDGCNQLSDLAFLSLARFCPFLQVLSFDTLRLSSVVDTLGAEPGDITLCTLLGGCALLRILRMRHCHALTASTIEAHLKEKSFPNLQQLDFTGCSSLQIEGITTLLNRCPSLHCFIVIDCEALTTELLLPLIVSHPTLTVTNTSRDEFHSGDTGMAFDFRRAFLLRRKLENER
jgi:hypothetical protein